jgi:hypothetical protein
MTTKNISELTPVETDFFNLLYRARSVQFDEEAIIKKDTRKQDEKRKVMKLVHIMIHNKDTVEGSLILYKKNKMARILGKFLINYYMKAITGSKKTNKGLKITEETDLLFD